MVFRGVEVLKVTMDYVVPPVKRVTKEIKVIDFQKHLSIDH